ncbi:MAG: FAD binding domain-containing protein [Acidobacteria bacterium]|nr:FAD binding domain-containing protein [Acidobacteriota bacterium]
MKIRFRLNDRDLELDAPPDRRVVDLLREDLGLTGTKESCGSGECGSCSVLVDGESRLSCLMLAAQLDGRRVTTIEGLSRLEDGRAIVDAFVRAGAVQCGFCTPGMVVATADLLARQPRPDRAAIRRALGGNLCRCTGYQKIVDAVEEAAAALADPAPRPGPGEAHRKTAMPPLPGPETGSAPGGPGAVPAMGTVLDLRPPAAERRRPDNGGGGTRQVLLPTSLDEVFELCDGATAPSLMAGGTDLLVALREGKAAPGRLVGLERVPELATVRQEADELVIGAALPLHRVAADPRVQARLDLLVRAIGVLGGPPVTHMATLGGNLCTASPAGDTLPPLYALGARVELRSRGGARVLPLDRFITGPRSVDLAPGEVLAAVRVKCPPPGGRSAYFKIGLRKAQAIAVASLAAWLRTEPDGTVADVRLAWGSVGPTVLTFPDVEAAIRGRPLEETALRKLAERVSAGVRPIGDVRAGAAYRRRAAGNLLIKLLELPPPRR